MNASVVLPLPPDVGTRLRGRGRAGGTLPNALELLPSPEPLPLGSVAVSVVVPWVARSGSDLLPGCVVDEKVVEFEGPGAPLGAAAVSSASSSSLSESARAVTKLPVRSEPASS
jgi:hypothetical protein